MKKVIRCRDVGYDCDGILHAYNEEELLGKVAAHAREKHDLRWVTPDVIEKLRFVMQEEDVAA